MALASAACPIGAMSTSPAIPEPEPVLRTEPVRGFGCLMAAQFASALADNALLLVSIALLQAQGRPVWWAPLLKFSFTLAYVLLAAFVGPLADAVAKPRLMMAMNALKVAGCVALLAGAHPLAALALVGVGAAAYAPAKYGLVTELLPPARLVWANGWIEVTTVGAVLLGTVFGGLLISPWAAALIQQATPGTPALSAALALLLLLYALAALLNLGVPDSGRRYTRRRERPGRMLRRFSYGNQRLWRDAEGGLSMAVTTLFWGAAAVLQFAVLRWAAQWLALPLNQAAYLQAAVAVGVVAGAALAGRWVALQQAARVLPLGLALGLLVAVAGWVGSVALAVPVLLLCGALGGALVVPMNALLQHRGQRLMSAGRSVAVQGFNENAAVLLMLGVYAALLWAGLPIRLLLAMLGLAVAAVMALLIGRERRRKRQAAGAASVAQSVAQSVAPSAARSATPSAPSASARSPTSTEAADNSRCGASALSRQA